jgi:hypothetical protein
VDPMELGDWVAVAILDLIVFSSGENKMISLYILVAIGQKEIRVAEVHSKNFFVSFVVLCSTKNA